MFSCFYSLLVFRSVPCQIAGGGHTHFATEGGVEYAPGREAAQADQFPNVGPLLQALHQSLGMPYPVSVYQCLQVHSEPAVHRIREVGSIRANYYYLLLIG